MREWERFSTAAANAYVQPLMARYLSRLEQDLRAAGLRRAAVPDAVGRRADHGRDRVPLPDPAGGERAGGRRDLLRRHVARECGLDRVLSFDMGGTTAKICLIDDFRAADLAQLRGGAGRAVQERLGPAAADSGDRDGRDRRRRRQPRARRCARPHQRRPGERRRRSRTRLLRARRRASGGDRRQPAARPLRPAAFRRRAAGARCDGGARRDRDRCRQHRSASMPRWRRSA